MARRRGPRRPPPLPQNAGAGGAAQNTLQQLNNSLVQLTQTLQRGLPGQSTNSQAASKALDTRINLASAAFVAQRAGQAVGNVTGQLGGVVGAAAFGFNAAGPAGALAAGAVEVLSLGHRNEVARRGLENQRLVNQNQFLPNHVEQRQMQLRLDDEIAQRERRSTPGGFVRSALDEGAAFLGPLRHFGIFAFGNPHAAADRERALAEKLAGAQLDPNLIGQSIAQDRIRAFTLMGGNVTPDLVKYERERGYRIALQQLTANALLQDPGGNQRGVSP